MAFRRLAVGAFLASWLMAPLPATAQVEAPNPLQVQNLDALAGGLTGFSDQGFLSAPDMSALRTAAEAQAVVQPDIFPSSEDILIGLPPDPGSWTTTIRDAFTADPTSLRVAPSAVPWLDAGSGPAFSNDATVPNLVVAPETLGAYQANVQKLVAYAKRPDSPVTDPGFLPPDTGPGLRILEGEPVMEPDVYMDTVMLFGLENGRPASCTGVLVAPDLVLTAAHCICRGVLTQVLVGTSFFASNRVIGIDMAASHSLLDCTIVNHRERFVEVISTGDLGVAKLLTPVPDIQPRQFANKPMIDSAASIRAVGFGKTTPDGRDDLRGKFLVDIIIASYDCSDIVGRTADIGYRCRATLEMIAAGAGRDTCGGDSGGPIYVLGADLQLYLAGITSRAVNPLGTCGDGGIYVTLSDPDIRSRLVAIGVPQDLFVPN